MVDPIYEVCLTELETELLVVFVNHEITDGQTCISVLKDLITKLETSSLPRFPDG